MGRDGSGPAPPWHAAQIRGCSPALHACGSDAGNGACVLGRRRATLRARRMRCAGMRIRRFGVRSPEVAASDHPAPNPRPAPRRAPGTKRWLRPGGVYENGAAADADADVCRAACEPAEGGGAR
eukprot:365252-Chlamydomonas_euryale.AAC.19